MTRQSQRMLIIVVFSLFVLIAVPCKAGGGKITGLLESGFDSFTEKYSIIEEDTLDDVTEFQTRINLGYLNGARFRDYWLIEGRATAGNNIYEGEGRLKLASSSATYRFGADIEAVIRRFRANSAYSFPNDYDRYYLRTYLQRQLSPAIALRVSDRLERMNFADNTEFDYDYWMNTVALSSDIDLSMTSSLYASIGYSAKSIPDTAEISYRAIAAHIDFTEYLGANRQIVLSIDTERRLYTHKPARSPLWEITMGMVLAPITRGAWGFVLENNMESYVYDRNSDVYFTYIEDKTGLLLAYNKSLDFQLRTGPTYTFFSSSHSAADEYREAGGKFTAEYAKGTKLWLSCSYERGWRFYRTYEAENPESIFSDYTFDRVTLFVTAKLWKQIGINSFFNHEPEKHKREGDDSTITLFSLSVTYAF
ncbi:MAG: hypothetical protein ABIA59_11040 [Candidatus Latescibacterota bacterium]